MKNIEAWWDNAIEFSIKTEKNNEKTTKLFKD